MWNISRLFLSSPKILTLFYHSQVTHTPPFLSHCLLWPCLYVGWDLVVMSMKCSQPVATEHWTKPDLSQTHATGHWEDQERTCKTFPIWNVHPVHKLVGWCPSSLCKATPICSLILRGPWKDCPNCLLFHLVFSPSFFHDYHLDNFYRLLLLAGMLLLLLSCIFPQRNPHSSRTRIL